MPREHVTPANPPASSIESPSRYERRAVFSSGILQMQNWNIYVLFIFIYILALSVGLNCESKPSRVPPKRIGINNIPARADDDYADSDADISRTRQTNRPKANDGGP
ncbi:jg5533 [Pararge aegeria aegeria]|uniref:Jg5533 protein n=1 Tax=Pararge aegeria aegeria TaxID=348720 RepID=A0A8S4SNM2_9NEOP|nr:jg5533 [Pararge aegeria aegeria]